jgi:TolB-like protein
MLNFLKELTRRKVWLFGGVYLGLGWVLLQVSIAIEATLSLPNWVDQITLIMLGLGFPIALLLAWAQESRVETTRAISKESTAASNDRATDAPSIVVLPFRARVDDEVEQLTAEGITDDITTLLTSVKGLKVAPRQAVVRTLSPGDDGLQIARDLGGRYVLTGSVRRNDNSLRVSCELTDLVDEEQRWSQKFDLSIEDIFAIQDEIAKGVVVVVGGVISRVEAARALRKLPEDLRVWELTRRAMSIAWDWRPETLHQGMIDARKAIDIDPNYALAHAWLAMILSWRSASGWTDEPETERAEALLEAGEAARLGFDDGEALWPALNAYWSALEPARAVQLYKQSIERQPDIFLAWPFAMGLVGVAYARIGREDEGLVLVRKFQEAHPNDAWGAVWTRVLVGYSELCRRNYSEVADLLTNTPSEFDGMCRTIALIKLDKDQDAVAEFTRWKNANPAINLNHYIEYFKSYHATEPSVGAELSDALVRLKTLLST